MTNTYDGEHFQVVLMNMRDGSVQGHAAGCADLKRGTKKFAGDQDPDAAWDVKTKAEAWLGYNSDFLAEGGEDNAYDIDWLPCAKHVPAGDQHAEYEAAFGEGHTPVAYQTPVGVVGEVKRGAKWTYLYAPNGELIAELRNDQFDAIKGFLA